jgi:hypothetical protein
MKTIKDLPEHSRPREVFADVLQDRAAVIIAKKSHYSFHESGKLS